VNEIFATAISCCITLVGWIVVVVVIIVMCCDVMMGDEVPYLSKYLRLLNDTYVQSLGQYMVI